MTIRPPAVPLAEASLADFPWHTQERVRYSDTDRQGHVNNVAYCTMLEAARVELLLAPHPPLVDAGCSVVIAQLTVNYLAEMTWPGAVDIGTRVAALGRSSVTLEHALFQNGRRSATSTSVIVQVNDQTHRSQAFAEHTRRALEALS